jgi:hypothetical protein
MIYAGQPIGFSRPSQKISGIALIRNISLQKSVLGQQNGQIAGMRPHNQRPGNERGTLSGGFPA